MSETENQKNFDFSGGRLCLDFTNTLTNRSSSSPTESLNTYRDLIAWSQQADNLNAEEARQLLELAQRQPAEAAEWLISIKQQREAIYRIFQAIAQEQFPQTEDMQQFNYGLAKALAHQILIPAETNFIWSWASDPANNLDRPFWFIARSAADLLTSLELGRVRICASDDCQWLFLDTSKNQSRRWCDMKVCGNRAKARRHQDRKKDSPAIQQSPS
jgi:predicted RNA-binding Zn ribbon-like protein